MNRKIATLTTTLALASAACSGPAEVDTGSIDLSNGIEAPFLDCSPFAGVWVGTEDRGSDDDEGGVYRPTLTLTVGSESQLSASDTIELFDDFMCTITTIELLRDGESQRSVTIVDEDTLQLGSNTLARGGAN